MNRKVYTFIIVKIIRMASLIICKIKLYKNTLSYVFLCILQPTISIVVKEYINE